MVFHTSPFNTSHAVKHLMTGNCNYFSNVLGLKEHYDVSVIMAPVFYSNFSNSLSTPCLQPPYYNRNSPIDSCCGRITLMIDVPTDFLTTSLYQIHKRMQANCSLQAASLLDFKSIGMRMNKHGNLFSTSCRLLQSTNSKRGNVRTGELIDMLIMI